MALPTSGPISLNDIRIEIGESNTANFSLKDAATGVYSPINQNSPLRPNGVAPYALSEWYGYDHSAVGDGLNCGGSLSVSGGKGIYILEAQLGSNTGQAEVELEAANIPDRFQLIYDGQVVADSLFIGDALPDTSYEYSIEFVTFLDKFVYDGNNFQPAGRENVDFGPSDIAQSNGSEVRSSGSGTGQLGVVSNFPSSSSKASNGNIKLFFNKTKATPTTMTIRVTGVETNTGWTILNLQCP